MGNTTNHFEERAHSHSGIDEMCSLLKQNRSGMRRGIYSVCSANRLVLEAAIAQALHDRSPLLIEATCNQVNQYGGYTGLTPTQFRNYVLSLAGEMNFPTERLILGGDHLGPNPWRNLSAAAAMEKACTMVFEYAAAGYSKIHLDASMSCADDRQPLASGEIAERAAQLCKVAESAVRSSSSKPVYVIGTEVPTPGGAQGRMEVEVTTRLSLQETLNAHQQAFSRANLSPTWERVIGVVVQPGVEFSNETIADYVPEKASELAKAILQHDGIVFEAHSTDYQTAESLRKLVDDHFCILKVGPELTFVMREAIFGLARIEEEWIDSRLNSNIRATIERVMVEDPEYWSPYYKGDETEMRIARAYSLSDRIRYYWPRAEVSGALTLLLRNLEQNPAHLPLIAQYLPHQAHAIRVGSIENNPSAMIRHRIQESLSRYAGACGYRLGE